jgi:aminocarboxymuconate-semialdehyde decarboxylase
MPPRAARCAMIDVHAHALHPDFLAELAGADMLGIERRGQGFGTAAYGELDPLLYDLAPRLQDLAARGVALQLISPPPRVVSDAGWAADAAFARRLNKQTARIVAASGGRLAGLAVPALAEPDQAVDEIRRAMDDDGLVGVALPTTAAGRPLDDGAFEALFAECARRRCPVFMHPTSGIERTALTSYTMLQSIGWPTETALCVARMIFAGVFERHPDLKLILAHGGGALLSLIGRLDVAYNAPHYEANPACRAHITQPPTAYLRHILFDTAMAHPGLLRAAIDLLGPANFVFGTDYPFEIGDRDGRLALPALDALPPETRRMIVSGTMSALLRTPPP